MDLTTLLSICKRYHDLGWAVQEQVDRLAGGEPATYMNGNALHMIEEWLRDTQRDLLPDTEDDELHTEIDAFIDSMHADEHEGEPYTPCLHGEVTGNNDAHAMYRCVECDQTFPSKPLGARYV